MSTVPAQRRLPWIAYLRDSVATFDTAAERQDPFLPRGLEWLLLRILGRPITCTECGRTIFVGSYTDARSVSSSHVAMLHGPPNPRPISTPAESRITADVLVPPPSSPRKKAPGRQASRVMSLILHVT